MLHPACNNILCAVIQVAWQPIVERLEPLAHIRLESQARLYARARRVHGDPPPPPPTNGDTAVARGVTVPTEDLPFFVDSDAWALEHGRMVAGHAHPLSPDPHGIPESILHFVGYVPGPAERPMRIQCSTGGCQGFKIAAWGGVTVLNSRDARSDLPLFLGTAVQQFRELLGLAPAGDWVIIPPRRRGAGTGLAGGVASPPVTILSPESDGVALWEVDWLVRRRYVQLMHETGAAVIALMDLVRSRLIPLGVCITCEEPVRCRGR